MPTIVKVPWFRDHGTSHFHSFVFRKKHIKKELTEIEQDPRDLIEWIDVVILALDGAWRAGYTPDQIVEALVFKQNKNESRKWPDWRTTPAEEPIEHDRYEDGLHEH